MSVNIEEAKQRLSTACKAGNFDSIQNIITRAALSETDKSARVAILKQLLPDGGLDIMLGPLQSHHPGIALAVLKALKYSLLEKSQAALILQAQRPNREVSYSLLWYALYPIIDEKPSEEEKKSKVSGEQKLLEFIFSEKDFSEIFSEKFYGSEYRVLGLSLTALEHLLRKTPDLETRRQKIEEAGPRFLTDIGVLKAGTSEPDKCKAIFNRLCETALHAGGQDLLQSVLVGGTATTPFDPYPVYKALKECWSDYVECWFEKLYLAGGNYLILSCIEHDNFKLWKESVYKKPDDVKSWLENARKAGGEEFVTSVLLAAADVPRKNISAEVFQLLTEWGQKYGCAREMNQKWFAPKTSPGAAPK